MTVHVVLMLGVFAIVWFLPEAIGWLLRRLTEKAPGRAREDDG